MSWLGVRDYAPVWQTMRDFTATRTPDSADHLWLLEHPRVYTLGRGGRPEHVLAAGDIPLVRSDRGGQVTYHGPGQLIVYTLIDLGRAGIGVRTLVRALEGAVIDLLARHAIAGERRNGAPGVYVGGAKIAALGLRVQRGRALHGMSLNVDMDLAPFAGIDPCGYPGLAVTQLAALGVRTAPRAVAPELAALVLAGLGLRSAPLRECAEGPLPAGQPVPDPP